MKVVKELLKVNVTELDQRGNFSSVCPFAGKHRSIIHSLFDSSVASFGGFQRGNQSVDVVVCLKRTNQERIFL